MLSKLTDNQYDQNGKTLISYNKTHSTTEQGILLEEQDNWVVGENEHILRSSEQVHSKSMVNQPTEHSLTKCQYCLTSFPYSLVEMHAQTCNENVANQTANILHENIKKCRFCRGIFPDSLLKQHTQTCNRRKGYHCSECNKVFQIQSKLLVHQQSHSDERLHSCNICAKPFKFKSGLSRHMKQQHFGRETTEFETTLCEELQGLEYSSLQDDENQQKKGTRDEISVKRPAFEREHLARTYIKTSRQGAEYGLFQEDLNHQKGSDHYEMVVNDSTQDKYKEDNFVKQYSNRAKTDLKAAMQGQENSSYSHKEGDDHCENIVKENDHCKSKESNIRDENFRQDPNSFEIEEKDLKQNDAMECEENVKEFNSEVNPRSSRISNECFSNLVPSVNMQSCAETKVYKCLDCPRIFEKPSRLRMHRRSHSDVKLFTCETCQQTFKYKGSLNRHIREQHYGQGRKSLSMVVDEKQRKEQENCLSAVKFGEGDMYFENVGESNDGVFRHWKERHYSQGGMSFSMAVNERQRNKLEDCSPLEKITFENDDECLVNVNKRLEDEDGVTGYLKGQDVGQDRRSLSKVIDETERNELASSSSLEKIEFQSGDENLLKQNESLEYKETSDDGESLDEGECNLSMVFDERRGGKTFILRDESSLENVEKFGENNPEVQEQEKNNLSMVFDEKQEGRKSLFSQDVESFENVDNTNEQNARNIETFKYGENNFEENNLEQEENISMVFHQRQGNEKTLSSQDESSFQNVDNTNEQNAGDGETFKYGGHNLEENSLEPEPSMVFDRRQREEKSLCSQDESSIQNVDNSSEFHMKETETCKLGENSFEVQERSKQEGRNFENDGKNLEEDSFDGGENIFEVNSRPGDAFNECFTDAILSVNTRRCEDDKVYQCEECQKVFVKRSAWSNHKRTHNDDMSFACEICWKYFKYKGSLGRHVKEQHYGLGRKDQGNYKISCSLQGRDNLHKEVESFGPIVKDVDYEECNSKERNIGKGPVFDKRPGNNITRSSQRRDNLHKEVKSFGPIVKDVDYEESKTPGNENSCSSKGEYNLQIRVNNFGAILNETDNRESNFDSRSMIFDKGLGSNNTYSSTVKVNLGSAVNEVDSKDSNSTVEQFEQSNFEVKEKSLDKKHDDFDGGQNNDETMVMELNLYINEKDDLHENASSFEHSLQNTEQEEKPVDTRQGKVDVCDDNVENVPVEITCDICGKYFKRKGSLNRHVKEQHYGLGRKSLRMNVDGNYGKVTCSSSSGENNFGNRVACFRPIVNEVACKDGNYKDGNVTPSMKFVVSEGNESSCSSLAKLDLQNRVSNLGTIVNDVCYKDDDFREETFEKEQSNLEMKEGYEHSEKDDLNKKSGFENILDEVDQKERNLNSKEDNFDGEQTNDATMVKEGNHSVQEKDDLNKNERSFEQGLEDVDQEERKMDSKEDSFDVHDDNIENSPLELTCEICGKYFKHKGSLRRHVKEQHYGLGRKTVKMFFSDKQRHTNSCSSKKKDDLQNEFNDSEAILNDDKQRNFEEKGSDPSVILDESQGSDNSCSSHGTDLQNRAQFGDIVNEVDYKDESFEQSSFEIEETSENEQNHATQQKDDFKKNEADFQLSLQDVDQEQSKLETKQDQFDACDDNIETVHVNVSEENQVQQSNVEFERRCREANVFKCEECPKIFPNRAALRKHRRVHSDEMSYTCEICQQTFKYKGSLNRHVKEQHYGLGRKGLRKMFDERVGKFYGCSSLWKVDNPASIDCKDGNFQEQNFEQDNFEVKERRLETKKCRNYDATTSKKGNYSMQENDDFEHNLQQQQEQETNLDTKQDNFVHDDSLEMVNKVEHEQSNFEMKNQNLDNKQNDLDAYQLEGLEKKKNHRCPDCPRTFWNSCELQEHTYKHTDVKSFVCRLCGKAFKFRSGLVRHNRKEHKKTDLIQSENRGCGIEGNGLGEENLQQKRSTFEIEESSVFSGQIGSNERVKRKFSGGEEDFKTVLGRKLRTEERCLNFENSDFGKGVGANELKKRKFREGEDNFDTGIDKRSEMEKRCLNFEFEESALGDKHHNSDCGKEVHANEVRKRKFSGSGKGFKTIVDETLGIEERSFANEEMSTQSVQEYLPVKKKSSAYNCNKCDAVFKHLCDFLTHQRIHK